MVYGDGTLTIFGGFTETGTTNEVITLEVLPESPNLEWKCIHPNDPERMDAPSPRAAHTSVTYQGTMWIFGGIDNENNRLNDLWALDLQTYIWTHHQALLAPSVF